MIRGALYLFLWALSFSPCFSTHPIDQKVVICGVCRDIGKQLFYSKAIVERIGALFADYRVVMYENNSADSTSSLLKDWERQNPRVFVRSETLSRSQLERSIVNTTEEGQLFRPEAIARARNEVLDIVFSPDYEDFPYLIWMDMDFVKHPNYQGFIEVFSSNQKWDAVFANGVDPEGKYWDWYACRFPDYPFGPEMLGMKWYRLEPQRIKALVIERDEAWVPVYSAFGGCGIYKKASIANCRYSGLVTEDMEGLAQKILRRGIECDHPQALLYVKKRNKLTQCVRINKNHLEKIRDDRIGIILSSSPDPIIWRMNTFTYHYPSVCEHVPFHASMIEAGHDKLFICPRLLFYY